MLTGTVFRNNRTQAVRLPKAVAFPDAVTHVTITVDGDRRILTPAVGTWEDWFATRQPDPHFLQDRDQSDFDERLWDAA
jgi:antitoxin VapB